MNLHMKTFTFRYIEKSQPIYTILRFNDPQKVRIKDSAFYTCSFDKPNNLVFCGFKCPQQAEVIKTRLQGQDGYSHTYKVHTFSIPDYIHYASTFSFCVAIVLNSWCDLETKEEEYEIHYRNVERN